MGARGIDSDEGADEPVAPRVRWGLGDAAGGFVVGTLLSGLVATAWVSASGRTDLSLAATAASQAALWVGLGGAPVVASRRKGSGSLAADFGLRLRPVDLALGAVAGVLAHVVLVPLVALLLQPLIGRPEVSQPVREVVDKAHGLGFVGLAVTLVVGAPLVEELFFRGLVLGAFRRRLGDAWGVGVTSLVFGLAHVAGLPPDAIVLLVASLAAFGAVLALLRVRTGRLGPGIVAHATFNVVTVAFIALGR